MAHSGITAATVVAAMACFALSARTVDLSQGPVTKTAIIQKALDETAAKGETLTIPAGRWISDGLRLPGGTRLELAEGAELVATTNKSRYASARAFLYAEDAEDIAVFGKGAIYGSGERFVVRNNAPGRPYAMYFLRCRNVKIEGVRMEAPAAWTCKIKECDGVTVRGIRIFSHVNFNNDGLDIEAKNMLVEDCDIDSDDDALCFKSDAPGFVSENIEVRNCRLSSNCNAIKFGTGSLGVWRDINIHDCTIFPKVNSTIRNWHKSTMLGGFPDSPQCLAGIALEVVDGGGMERVTIRNIRMDRVQTPIVIRHAARTAAKDGRETFLRDILIENVKGTALSRIASSITGIARPDLRPKNITLRNIDLSMPGGATEEMGFDRRVPEAETSYPENRMFGHILPAWGLYVRHADGVKLDNVRLALSGADARKVAVGVSDASVTVENCNFAAEDLGWEEDPCAYVDPFIGTAGTANCMPSACVPHGLVQPGPSSGTGAWKYCGGYQIEDRRLYGFIQDAISGTGVPDLGDLLVQPFVGDGEDSEYRAVKGRETASPGYYSVRYPKSGNLLAEGTATEHASFWRFTYGGGKAEPHLLVDLQWGHANKGHLARRVKACEVSFPSATTMAGHVKVSQWVNRDYYFFIRFNRKMSPRKIEPREKGLGDRYVLDFDLPGNAGNLDVKIGLSATSIAAARANLDAEMPHWHFADFRNEAAAKWAEYLSRIKIEGTAGEKTRFYTSMWHLGIAPNNMADHGKPPFYSTLSFWDTFRAAHPLFTIIQPERVPDMVNSCFKYYEKNGFLPIWALWGEDNQCMIGTHSVPVIVDAFMKGFDGVDWPYAYEAIRDTLRNKHPGRRKEGWEMIDRFGYYPTDMLKGEGVSRLLECSYDDWCAAQMAAKMGKAADAEFFAKRAANYKNVFDPSIGLVRGKDSKGKWREPFDPLLLGHGAENDNDFTEGNSWQYTWHVMHDPEGLISLFGGRKPFLQQLDRLFGQLSETYGHDKHDVTGLIGQYAHGNEPSHHVAYFFQYAGAPHRTAEIVREICDKFYRNAPDGLSGNDDCGQMSAWYIFSALGFYPFNPCGGDYVIGAPQVKKATVRLPGGKTFTVVAKDLSRDNKYVKSVSLNGKPLEGFVLKHADVVAGGELVFQMSSEKGDGETVLWPSDATVLHAQPDSKIASLPDGSVGVTTGTEYSWPGVRMDFRAGEFDLSPFGHVRIAVSNTTDRADTVHLSVKGRMVQGETPGGGITLAPHASGELVVYLFNMPWRLDEPLALYGMNGRPKAAGGSTFDLRRTFSFHIFRNKDGRAGGFSVRRVTASGTASHAKVLSASTFLPFVDRFGQFKHDEWPGKIHDEKELSASRAAEEAWLKENGESPIPDADRFGGWKGGPRLQATGFFRTEKVNGKWWLVDPDGHLFFSHGVDCVRVSASTGIGFREKYFEWVPESGDPVFGRFRGRNSWPAAHGFYKDPAHLPYDTYDFARANAVRKYGAGWQALCAARAHDRIRAWGLNTIANWSDPAIYGLGRTPYVATFNTSGPAIEGSTGWWGKLRDPFAPAFIENVKRRSAEEAKRTGSDPWCMGWFVDNELSWGHDDLELGRAVLRSPAAQPAKTAARAMLEGRYGTAAKLDAAWKTRYGSWEGFLSATNVPDEKLCGPDLKDIHRAVVGQYFRTVRDAIKSVAPNRLYLGARIAWGGDVVFEECARYCDVVSVNIYSRRPARDLPATAADKPMISGEFHFGALDRGMFHTGLVSTANQDERARCYRDYVNFCLDHPRFVGTHWFQWQDQALTGRSDGENYQIGFVTVTDAPYPELVRAARDIGATMYRRRMQN